MLCRPLRGLEGIDAGVARGWRASHLPPATFFHGYAVIYLIPTNPCTLWINFSES